VNTYFFWWGEVVLLQAVGPVYARREEGEPVGERVGVCDTDLPEEEHAARPLTGFVLIIM